MPVRERRPKTGEQPRHARESETRTACRRMDARVPTRLGGVDVPDAGEESLIEEGGLDGACLAREPYAQGGCRECRVLRLWPEMEHGGRVGCEPLHGAERTGIGEGDAAAAGEFERHARVRGERVRRARVLPVAVQAEVHEQGRAVVEHDELVLAATHDVEDPPPLDAWFHPRGELPPLRRVVGVECEDLATARGAAQATDGEFDFRQFRQSRDSCARGTRSRPSVGGGAKKGVTRTRVR